MTFSDAKHPILLLSLALAGFTARPPAAQAKPPQLETAIFAGGCFWCMTPPFEKLKGVTQVLSGYIGGTGVDPTYEDYAERGFVEAVQVTYDPSQIDYPRLLDVYWRQINPTDGGGQFVDRGPQYRPVIYYLTPEQKKLAEASKQALAQSGRFELPIVVEILPAAAFYKAEEYHQDYYKKNPVRYHYYRYLSGRDQFLKKAWGKPLPVSTPSAQGSPLPGTETKAYTKEELKKMLTPLQYEVTQEGGTEPAFHNAYWDNHQAGIYVDVVSGEPLFSSLDKFDSGTGWPSFSRPLEPSNIVEKTDHTFFMTRTEVKSAHAGSHLGHVFDDGPAPTGLRYCIDSAALRFIPMADLQKDGYGEYLKLFRK